MGYFFSFGGSNGLFLRSGNGPKTVLGCPHVVEQLSFSMIPSILTFNFDLILTFGGLNGPFFWVGYGSKTVVGVS